jgi:redox-sensitive bicupin YhaK (pirin superfamily)
MQQILSPNAEDAGVWIHQDAWFHLGKFDKGSTTYSLKKGNGVYAFILSGKVTIDGQELETRDGLGIWDVNALAIEANERSFIDGYQCNIILLWLTIKLE